MKVAGQNLYTNLFSAKSFRVPLACDVVRSGPGTLTLKGGVINPNIDIAF